MDFAFEVRESDLLGRVGVLKVGNKSVETPCLFPVIHPVSQAVTTKELLSMGFHGLMTNSYIIGKRRRDEALSKGIHRLLDFDGMLMTDSGGYQVLEYGDLGVGYAEVARFQADIGSDLAVTLDRPTGFSKSAGYARGTMEYSLHNAVATLKEFGERDTVWLGPVQGGLFPALVRKSARSLSEAGFEFLALGSPVQVMENYRFGELVRMISASRSAMPYSVPLHLFGAGHPLTMAIAVALGCDTFDSASYILFAREGRYMTERGVSRLETMKFLPCSCPVCNGTSIRGLAELGHPERTRSLSIHNLFVLKKEVEACKEAIAEGRLWDLVHEKGAAHPRLHEALAEFAKVTERLREGTPPLKDRGLFVRDSADLGRPELMEAKARLSGAMRRRSLTAVLAPDGEGVPLAMSRRSAGRPEGVDLYKIHPCLGVYPAELEFVYPFTQSVVSSGSVAPDLRGAVKQLRSMGYVRVVVEREEATPKVRSRRKSRAPSPSAPASSLRPRSLRRPL